MEKSYEDVLKKAEELTKYKDKLEDLRRKNRKPLGRYEIIIGQYKYYTDILR